MSAGEWWGTAAVVGLWGLVILSVWWRDRGRRGGYRPRGGPASPPGPPPRNPASVSPRRDHR